MALSDLKLTVLEIINEVRRKFDLNTVEVLTGDKYSRLYIQFLNEIITDCSDFGDWAELYKEVTVLVSAAQATYSLGLGYPVQSILEIAFDTDPAPLEYREISDLRILGRVRNNSNGTPRQFTIKGVDSRGNPEFTVYPTPTTAHQTSAKTFDVALYKKPELLTTNSIANRPDFPANLLIQGLYAYALLDENSGAPTMTTDAAFALYEQIKKQSHNRYTTDTGTDVWFTPNGQRR